MIDSGLVKPTRKQPRLAGGGTWSHVLCHEPSCSPGRCSPAPSPLLAAHTRWSCPHRGWPIWPPEVPSNLSGSLILCSSVSLLQEVSAQDLWDRGKDWAGCCQSQLHPTSPSLLWLGGCGIPRASPFSSHRQPHTATASLQESSREDPRHRCLCTLS